jgi:hypothetical protein
MSMSGWLWLAVVGCVSGAERYHQPNRRVVCACWLTHIGCMSMCYRMQVIEIEPTNEDAYIGALSLQ